MVVLEEEDLAEGVLVEAGKHGSIREEDHGFGARLPGNLNHMDRIKLLLELHEADPSDPFTLFALGFEHQKRERLKEALKWYRATLSADQDYTGVYYHLGKLYVELGRPVDAEQTYKEGILICSQLRALKERAELQQALMELDNE